jgi:rhodanese-related sulfurtransferase
VNLTLVAILATIGFSAAMTRFLRQGAITEPLRLKLSARSPLLEKLFSCPHCLCFWNALACAALLARSWVEFVILILLGWRGAYYLNSLFDYLQKPSSSGRPKQSPCQVCCTPWNDDFLQRRGFSFCSHRCWFDYLKTMRQEVHRSDQPLFDDRGVFIRQEIILTGFFEVEPARAKELLDGDEGYVYVDVRSAPEFANGRPTGAVNVPLFHYQGGKLAPNHDFLRVMKINFPQDAKLLVGCQVGSRSRPAVEALADAGYSGVANVTGGFGGTRDQLGKIVTRGWLELGLPVEYGSAEDQDYETLAAKTKK